MRGRPTAGSQHRARGFAAALALLVAGLLAPRTSRAQPVSATVSSTSAPRVSAARRLFSLSGPYEPRFSGEWLLDHAVRSHLRARSSRGRQGADHVSDALLALSVASPWAASTIIGLSHQRDLEAVGELALVDAEGLGLTLVVSAGFKILLGRERPYATDQNLAAFCREPGMEHDARCSGTRNASFVSGHAATAFASAGLLCAQTAYASPRGDPVAFVACSAAMGFAAGTSVLRIVADKHHATDVLAGMVLGLSAGLAVPMILHFADGAILPVARDVSIGTHDYLPMLGSIALGIAIGGGLPVLIGLTHGGASETGATVHAWFAPVAFPGGAGAGVTGVF